MSDISFGIDKQTLQETIEEKIAWLNSNIKRDKRKTRNIEISAAVAAASTTALIGLSKFNALATYADALQALALLISATSTILLAWDKLFDHKRLWVLSASMRNDLVELRNDLMHADKTQTLDAACLVTFYAKSKEVMRRGAAEWTRLRQGG